MLNYLPPFVVLVFGIVWESLIIPDSGVVGRCLEFYNENKKSIIEYFCLCDDRHTIVGVVDIGISST
jgi:hypothetical protein